MSLRIYDPHAHIMRQISDCEVAEQENGLTPVKSEKDGQWFAVNVLSGESVELTDLEGDDLRVVRESITTHRLVKRMLDCCHQVQGEEGAVERGPSIVAAHDLADQYGAYAVDAAQHAAVSLGFTTETIARAYLLIGAEGLIEDAPVTRLPEEDA